MTPLWLLNFFSPGLVVKVKMFRPRGVTVTAYAAFRKPFTTFSTLFRMLKDPVPCGTLYSLFRDAGNIIFSFGCIVGCTLHLVASPVLFVF